MTEERKKGTFFFLNLFEFSSSVFFPHSNGERNMGSIMKNNAGVTVKKNNNTTRTRKETLASVSFFQFSNSERQKNNNNNSNNKESFSFFISWGQ